MKKILIAGASGFIGQALIEFFLENDSYELVALSRKEMMSHHKRLIWKKCDLFSLKDIHESMKGCDEAFYLVHSMLPSASLSQGTFYDFDLIMADNFVRAAKKNKLNHIIYLGGMIPKDHDLSWHLKSRLEVEQTLRNSGIPTTVLRSGLIIGPKSSSFMIIQKLIERLPIMICPNWTHTKSRPVGVNDVLQVMKSLLVRTDLQGRIYDISGPEEITYKDLILRASLLIKKRTTLFSLSVVPLSLSRFWVSLISGVPRNLVYPLVLSLKHEMLPSAQNYYPLQENLKTGVDDMLKMAFIKKEATKRKNHNQEDVKDVRSIQRLVLPKGKNAKWVAEEYFRWLPTFFSNLVRVKTKDLTCVFYLIHPSIKLLILRKSEERSSSDRQLLYVIGGLLSQKIGRGRLEFREVLNGQYIMAALHEFRPSLPWFIYKWTQAIAHLIVMRAFGEHLKWCVISNREKL